MPYKLEKIMAMATHNEDIKQFFRTIHYLELIDLFKLQV